MAHALNGFKFFSRNSNGTFSLFNVEACEECGCEIEGVNSMTSVRGVTPKSLRNLNMTEREMPGDSGGYCDATDTVCCSSCCAKLNAEADKARELACDLVASQTQD
jgi:hypothetical protein